MKFSKKLRYSVAAISTASLSLYALQASADQVILDDLIVNGSACVGQDCVNGESFGFDTLRLKENNLRIKFDDTSNSSSFPNRDWQLTANDSTNGGANKFSIDDITGGRTPFTIEAGAPSHSLFVDDGGRIGLGTSTPVVEAHIVDGDSPTVRLEQNGSSGFTPQTWDMAGNEANFFIRDVTNGSRLSFRIKPGAPEDSIFIAADGDVGLGTDAPSQAVHIRGSDNRTVFVENTQASADENRPMFWASNNGGAQLVLQDRTEGRVWKATGARRFIISDNNNVQKFRLDTNGNVDITGDLTTGGAGACSAGCDAVFEADYDLPTIEEHAEAMWSNGYLPTVGPTTADQPFNVTQKVGRMLNELEKAHIYIAKINEQNKILAEENDALRARLDAIEARLQ
ncbi:MAG: hypothetical protein HKN36_13270 [Hellea sp.]|nr:hypothetical protein [Hellea sp.]